MCFVVGVDFGEKMREKVGLRLEIITFILVFYFYFYFFNVVGA